MPAKSLLKSVERLVPSVLSDKDITGDKSLALHLERYRFAAQQVAGGHVLDMACGVGYGSAEMAAIRKDIHSVTGVDLSDDAVAYAKSHYGSSRVTFRVNDAMTYEASRPYDSVVSLETIEHVENPEHLVARLRGLVRLGGVIVASVPTTPSVDVNPFHRTDFSEESFRRMFDSLNFQEVACLRQVQPYPIVKVLRRSEERMTNMRKNLVKYYARNPMMAMRRLKATLQFGFSNRYLTVAYRRTQ